MSTAFKGLVYADSMTVLGVVGNGTSGVGANLTYSGSDIAVATLTQAAPTLDSYSSLNLNSDAVDLTLTGMGFDNAATDSSGNYLSNIVTFTASQEGPVTVNPNIQNVTRSTMIVSFWKLNTTCGNLELQSHAESVLCMFCYRNSGGIGNRGCGSGCCSCTHNHKRGDESRGNRQRKANIGDDNYRKGI